MKAGSVSQPVVQTVARLRPADLQFAWNLHPENPMELRQYWAVIRRWWWIPVLTVLLVAAFTLVTARPWQPKAPSYTTSLSFSIGLKPEKPADGEENYYTALASEYLIDDLSEVVRGSEFASAVSQRLQAQGITSRPAPCKAQPRPESCIAL